MNAESTTAGLWQVREYDAAHDAVMVCAWWAAHGEGRFPLGLLPPTGLVAEVGGKPVAACWLYMALGVGLCWLEWPVSIPGLALSESREAFTKLVEAMEVVARAHNYPVMIAHTLPPIARMMKGMGFAVESRLKITVVKEVAHGG